jgi:hypothetical protein
MTINTFEKGDVARIISNKYTGPSTHCAMGPHPFDNNTLVHIIKRHEGPANFTQPGPDYYLVDLDPNGKGMATVHAHDMVFIRNANQDAVNAPQVLLVTTDVAFIRELHAETNYSKMRRKIEEKFPELFKRTYNIGMVFQLSSKLVNHTQDYLLTQVSANMCALINLTDGNRRKDPVMVNDIRKITKAELRSMVGDYCDWKVVKECPYPNLGR